MIYCVVPRPLEGELFDRLNDYYKDEPNVEVIVDRPELLLHRPDNRAASITP